MHRIDTTHKQVDKFGSGKHGYTQGTPGTALPTETDADAFDAFQEEILSVVETAGVAPVKGTNTQLLSAFSGLLNEMAILNFADVTPAGSHVIEGVVWGNNIWVAVGATDGANTYCAFSVDDGVTWTRSSVAGLVNLNFADVTYGNSRFVAVGGDGTVTGCIYTSTDGDTWTDRSGGITWAGGTQKSLRAVYWNGSMFVAVGYRFTGGVFTPVILTSADGTTWVERICPLTPATLPMSVWYGNGRWTIVGEAVAAPKNIIWTSTNGTTWSACAIADISPFYCYDVTYGSGIWVVACGVTSGAGTATFFYSTDGTTWLTITTATGFKRYWNAITYGNGLFVAVGYNGGITNNFILYSRGSTTVWNKSAPTGPLNVPLHDIAQHNGVWILGGENGGAGYLARSLQVPVLP